MNIKEAFESLAKVTFKGLKNPFFVIRGLYQTFNEIADEIEEIPSADKIEFDNTGTTLSSDTVQGAIEELDSAITTSTQVVNSPTANINIPSSGDYIGFVYLSRYVGSAIEEQGGFYVIKRYHETSGDATHITTVKAMTSRTLDSYTENGSTISLTFSTNLSNFVQAIVFKL